jgi:hypothetical protein
MDDILSFENLLKMRTHAVGNYFHGVLLEIDKVLHELNPKGTRHNLEILKQANFYAKQLRKSSDRRKFLKYAKRVLELVGQIENFEFEGEQKND